LHPLSSYLWLCHLVLLWCTNSSECEHDLRRAFNIMLLVLKGNLGSELASYLLFLWLSRRHFLLDVVAIWFIFLKTPDKCVGSPSTLWLLPRCQLCSCWGIPSLPSIIFIIIDNPFDFISSWACPCYGCHLQPSLYFVLPWSITVFYVENVVRIAPPLRNSWHKWYFSPPPFFLGPRVDFNRDTNQQTILLGFYTSSNPIALKLSINSSFFDCWLLNRHSYIDLAA
jgi:hypothetical protein